jgi:hypothetical protein
MTAYEERELKLLRIWVRYVWARYKQRVDSSSPIYFRYQCIISQVQSTLFHSFGNAEHHYEGVNLWHVSPKCILSMKMVN